MTSWMERLRSRKSSAPEASAPEWKDRGNRHFAEGEHEEAGICFRQAIALDPRYAEAHHNLGLVLLVQGNAGEALALFQSALALKPDLVPAYLNAGNALRQLGRTEEAIASFMAALAINPDLPEGHNNVGVLLQAAGNLDRAALSFREALRLDSAFAEARYNMGRLLHQQGRSDEARDHLQRAIRLQPALAQAYNELGLMAKERGELLQARDHFEKAAALDPQFSAAHSNLGALLRELDEPERAIDALRHAVSLAPGDADARFNLGFALLAAGRLEEGWAGYGYRFSVSNEPAIRRPFDGPEWRGEPLAGRSLLLWGDQGVGDEILFASMIGDCVPHAGRCIVECAAKLVPLFSHSFPEAVVVPRMSPPHPATLTGVDFQCGLADAARWLRPDIAAFADHGGYLSADPVRTEYWAKRLAGIGPGLKVGFSWRGGLGSGFRSLHYTQLDQWEAIFSIPGVHFVNLQYGECGEELREAEKAFRVRLHNFSEVDLFDDLFEAAALIRGLDLVLTAPTATAFLCAALGVPTWMMSYTRPWQMLGTDRVPWYPAMRCFTRRWDQPWQDVIGEIARALGSYKLGPC